MKRMELRIIITFVIMFIVRVIISGLFHVSMGFNFFTFKVITNGLFGAIAYLSYVWIQTRKHQLLAATGVSALCLTLCLIILFVSFSPEEITGFFTGTGPFSNLNRINIGIYNIVMLTYYMIAFEIAGGQSKKLLEEDNSDNSKSN